MGTAGRLGVNRLRKKAVLENARRIGFQPGTIIDVGFAYGTEGLYDGFEDVPCILIDPVAEAEPAMKAFCEAHPGSAYYVAAASDAPGEVRILAREGVSGSSIHVKKAADGEWRTVPAITLDAIVAERRPPKPYLIKLDVEGHELHVLKGAAAALKDTEMVILEVSTWAEDNTLGRPSLIDLFLFMNERGFVFYEFVEPSFRPIDGALYMFDAVFVKTDSILRKQRKHKTVEQAAVARQVKAEHAESALAAPPPPARRRTLLSRLLRPRRR